jgi:hypothetical protein
MQHRRSGLACVFDRPLQLIAAHQPGVTHPGVMGRHRRDFVEDMRRRGIVPTGLRPAWLKLLQREHAARQITDNRPIQT